MLTHTHICIPYYILIDTHACVACILINRAQTQRSAPAPTPAPATAIGRLGGTWPCYKAATDCFFFNPLIPALPYPTPYTTLHLSRVHSCSHLFIYSLPSHFQFFACKLEKFKRNREHTLPKAAASEWRLTDPKVFCRPRHRGAEGEGGESSQADRPCSICSSSKATDKSNNKCSKI